MIKINPTKETFYYGGCASIAIAQAFDIPTITLKCLSLPLKLGIEEGLTFSECVKLINILSKATNRASIYFPNTVKVNYNQLINVLKTHKVIVMFDEHLSYFENGEIFDDWFCAIRIETIKSYIPTGWWVVNKLP